MKRWVTATCDRGLAEDLAAAARIQLPIAVALINRGITTADQADRFFKPRLSSLADPGLLPHMSVAIDRLWRAITGGEKIVIFGDYDVDGIASAALIHNVLKQFGLDAPVFLPNRFDEGYGMTPDAFERLLATHAPTLIITVDSGTTAADTVRAATARGIDVIVTDHHEAAGVVAPAIAVVNPKLGDDPAARVLAGVGVTFKLCHALVRHARAMNHSTAVAIDLRQYLDMVALGTIADIVPMTHENRILAAHGLMRLNDAPTCGIRALATAAGIKDRIDTYHVGFMLGPRINAAGRLGDPYRALELLLTGDPARASALATELNEANAQRKKLENDIVTDARKMIDASFNSGEHFGLAVAAAEWHPGVLGIAASRLSSLYCRPSVVASFDADGLGRGSCRSFANLDLMVALKKCGPCLDGYGGHQLAAGITVNRDNWAQFQRDFNDACREVLQGRELCAELAVDGWIALTEADRAFMDSVDKMRPFGPGNPEPVWGARDVHVAGAPRRVGENHLKLSLAGSGAQLDAIAFGKADQALPEGPLDVVFTLNRNIYRGYTTIQLQIKDWAPAGQSSSQ